MVFDCMKKIFREISLLVILPLILMSVSLTAIGTSHTIKVVNTNRITTLRQASINVPIHCDENLCHNITNLEHALLELEKQLLV